MFRMLFSYKRGNTNQLVYRNTSFFFKVNLYLIYREIILSLNHLFLATKRWDRMSKSASFTTNLNHNYYASKHWITCISMVVNNTSSKEQFLIQNKLVPKMCQNFHVKTFNKMLSKRSHVGCKFYYLEGLNIIDI